MGLVSWDQKETHNLNKSPTRGRNQCGRDIGRSSVGSQRVGHDKATNTTLLLLFSTVNIKFSRHLHKNRKNTPNICMEPQNTLNHQNNLQKKDKAEDITLPDFVMLLRNSNHELK